MLTDSCPNSSDVRFPRRPRVCFLEMYCLLGTCCFRWGWLLTLLGPLHRCRRRHGVRPGLHRRLVGDDKGDCVGEHQDVEAAGRILCTLSPLCPLPACSEASKSSLCPSWALPDPPLTSPPGTIHDRHLELHLRLRPPHPRLLRRGPGKGQGPRLRRHLLPQRLHP